MGKGSATRFASACALHGHEVGGKVLPGSKKGKEKSHKDPDIAKSALREIQSRQRREKINA